MTIGEFNTIGPFAAIGGDAQDLSYRGGPTRVLIGDHNLICQGVTIHRGSEKEDGTTRLGSRNTLLASSHVAHDCQLGDEITIGEGTMLGGHVHVGDHVHFGCAVAVIHFITIGTYGSVGMKSKVNQDIPCYLKVDGNPSKIRRVNSKAMIRDGYPEEAIEALHEAWRLIFGAKVRIPEAIAILKRHDRYTMEVDLLIESIERQRRGRNGRSRG